MPSYTNLDRRSAHALTLPNGSAVSVTDIVDYNLAFYAPLLSEAEPLFQGVALDRPGAPFIRELPGGADETGHLEVVLTVHTLWVICGVSASRTDLQIELWNYKTPTRRTVLAGRTLQNFDLVAPLLLGVGASLAGIVRLVPGADVGGPGADIVIHGYTHRSR